MNFLTKAFADIRVAYKEQLNVWLAAGLIVTAISFPSYFFKSEELAILLLSLLSIVITVMVYPGVTSMALLSVRGKKPELSEILNKAHLWLKMLGLFIVYGLMVIFGLIALIIPGIYLAVRYWPAAYILVEDGKVGVFDAFARAQNLTKGKIPPLLVAFFIFFFLFAGLTIVPDVFISIFTDSKSWWRGLVSFVVAVLLFPATTVGGASVYNQLIGKSAKAKK